MFIWHQLLKELFVKLDKKVISVVSDNAKNMVKAWDIFIKNNPSSQISFFGCAGHVLNLLCKDIVNLPTFR